MIRLSGGALPRSTITILTIAALSLNFFMAGQLRAANFSMEQRDGLSERVYYYHQYQIEEPALLANQDDTQITYSQIDLRLLAPWGISGVGHTLYPSQFRTSVKADCVDTKSTILLKLRI